MVAHAGSSLDGRGESTAALVVPPADETLLPALNRRVADAGIPWRFEPRPTIGAGSVAGEAAPEALQGVTVRERFSLVRAGEGATPTRTLAEVAGEPWLVEGSDARGRRYLLLASPLTPTASELPVSTGMLRFVDWAASSWAGAATVTAELTTGSHLPAAATATHVRFPSGDVREIDGTRTVRGTGESGFYDFLAADSVVGVAAMNPPDAESDLTALDAREYAAVIGPELFTADDEGAWGRSIFRARQGPELWWPLLLAALLLLAAEMLMATSGSRDRKSAPAEPSAMAHATE